MNAAEIEKSSTTNGLPVSPSMGPSLVQAGVPTRAPLIDRRVVWMCGICVLVGIAAAFMAWALIHLIALITNLSFYGRWSIVPAPGSTERFGAFVIFIPVIGGLIVGLMARFGSRGVQGHGIPEAMEQVLENQSRIPPRMTFLKPLSAAIAIGTGGPFGAEGPIIASGGAVGSLIGQLLPTTTSERKTLLAAGAAAGIAAAFSAPISAVLLAIELLLFEFSPRSLIPVALASAVATALRAKLEGPGPMFHFTGPAPLMAGGSSLLIYTLLGAIIGVGAVIMTRTVYWIEEKFDHMKKIPWMLHPAIGAIAVGVIGYFSPRTFGPGYFNLDYLISDKMLLASVATLCVLKFFSWTISLGSGTAGGTLAPVFTIGGSLAVVISMGLAKLFPAAGIDLRIAALVGMTAIFAGSSRALLTSVALAYETTLVPAALLPALCGCSAAYLVSSLLMSNSIMTEKMVRRGVRVPTEFAADYLDQVLVREVCSRNVITLAATQTIGEVRQWLRADNVDTAHQGFPILTERRYVMGVLTRRDLLDPANTETTQLGELLKRPPIVVYDDCTLREAADHMVNHDVGRLPVMSRANPSQMVGILTRGDLLRAHRQRLEEINLRVKVLRRGN